MIYVNKNIGDCPSIHKRTIWLGLFNIFFTYMCILWDSKDFLYAIFYPLQPKCIEYNLNIDQ